MTINRFTTPELLLFGPGPSNPYPEALQAIAQPTLGHLDSVFITILDEIQALLKQVFQTKSPYVYVVSGPGSLGMETCFVNLIEAGDQILMCRNGYFANRMYENATRYGAKITSVEAPWGKAIDPAEVEKQLQANPSIKLLSVVHAETSTGVLNDVKTIAAIAKNYGCLVIVDAVTSLGANTFDMDGWQIDAVYSCSQKGLGSVPGMAPIAFSAAAFDKIKNRTSAVLSWFQDITVLDGYWGGAAKRPYHHTAPANQYYALLASLRILIQNSLAATWEKHTATHRYFAEQLSTQGWSFFVAPEDRIPQLNTVLLPEGLDDAGWRNKIRQEHLIEIGAGLGEMSGKLWRIGFMGYNANNEAVDKLISVIKLIS